MAEHRDPNVDPIQRRTLPGDIPGLLRRGSPCVRLSWGQCTPQEPVLVHSLTERSRSDGDDGTELAAEVHAGPWRWWPVRQLALDLTDPTGRVHAQWWAWTKPPGPPDSRRIDEGNEVLTHRADDSAWWTPERIALLAEVVLRLAGRWPAAYSALT